jgi:hypothetical protein
VGADNVTIQNTYLGTSSANGVGIESGANGNNLTIGGTGAYQRNYISGNTNKGISIADTTTVLIKGNYIGTNIAGDAALANATGIQIDSGANTVTIGGTGAEANTISGNTGNGIRVLSGSSGVNIYGNYIGTNPTGTGSIGNGGRGILVETNSVTIGSSSDATKANVISANSNNGIEITGSSSNNSISLNTIRTNLTGIVFSTSGNGNLARQNNFLNCVLMIDLASGNDDLTSPIITSATSSHVTGTTIANGIVDIFVDGTWTTSTTADASGIFAKSALYSGTEVYASVTNGNNSTSGITSPGTVITADLAAPEVPVISNTASATNQSTVVLTGTKEANSSIWVNGAETIVVDALTIWTTPAQALVEGANTFSITSKDGAGNTSTAASYSITMDTGLPGTPTLSATTPTADSTGTITGSGTEAGATVYKDGTATSTIVDGTGGFTLSVSLVDGPNTFSIKAVDAAGNESSTSSITIQKNGGGTGFSNSSFHQEHIDTDTDSEDETDDEVVEEISEEDNSENADENSKEQFDTKDEPQVVPTPDEQISTLPAETPNEPPKTSFVKDIIKVVEHVKTETEKLRENLPEKPALEPKYETENTPPELITAWLGNKDANLNADFDFDGLLNGEEILYGGDPYEKDADNDGISDLEEVYIKGTDPSLCDSDHDGTTDKVDQNPLIYNDPTNNVSPEAITSYMANNEIAAPLGTVDSDKDGLNDLQELYFGTDPKLNDSDSDGLSDGDEYNFYGTDPLTKTDQKDSSVLHITNLQNKEFVSSGEQFLIGSAKANETVTFYSISADGTSKVIGQTKADENGKYAILTEKLSEGLHTISATSGGETISDISKHFTINVRPRVKEPLYMGFDPQGDLSTANRTPALELKASEKQEIMIVWHSAILSQTLIADASGQTISAKPVENLELGQHTVTWYAINLENGSKSAPTQMDFSIINTAFMSGDNGNNKIVIILGSLSALLAISTLTLLIKRRKNKLRNK